MTFPSIKPGAQSEFDLFALLSVPSHLSKKEVLQLPEQKLTQPKPQDMDVPAEIEGLKMAVNNLGNQITQLMIMVQDIRDRFPEVQENLQRPGKSPKMVAALAKISELEESVMEGFKPIDFENFAGTGDAKMHQWDIERDNLTPKGERFYSEKGNTLLDNNNNHVSTTPSSINSNSSFTTNTISKVKPTNTTTQIN
jgi:hypothetical protein